MNTILKKTISMMLCLVLLMAYLPVGVMAAETQETKYYPKTVSINSNTNPFYSPAYPNHEGEHHQIATVQTEMMIPEWVFYYEDNNGSARYYLTVRFERYAKEGNLGYKVVMTAHFYAHNDPTQVFYTIDIGDGDEIWKAVNYNNGVQQVNWESFTDAVILNRDMSKVQQLTTYDGSADISSNTDHTVNIGEGVKVPDPGQINITKTVSGLEEVDALTDGVYYITVQGTREDLSFYHLDLSQGHPVENEDGSITYSWVVPVVPSGSMGGQDNQAYVVKENKHFIPGYTCDAYYKIVHGDGHWEEHAESGSGAVAKPITIYTNKYGSVDFTNVYQRADVDTKNREYVIDFGLPVEFTLDDLKLTMLDEDGKEIPITDRGVQVTKLEIDADAEYKYGAVEFIADDEATKAYDPKISYTPNVIVNGSEKIPVKIWVNGRQKEDYDFDLVIYPATTVYYEEDGFVGFENSKAATQDSGFGIWTSPWGRVSQTTEMLGEPENIYGYDAAYGECKTYSLGKAKSVTVNAATGKRGEAPYATFKFKGTGFDIVSLTDNTSGSVIVYVDGKRVMTVDNYYGYDYNEETDKWEVNKENGANALYQVPVIKVEGLTYGEHTVKVEAAYIGAMDQTEDVGYTFWFDAVRIYDPMGDTIDDKYAQDGENDPQYKTVRDLVVGTTALDSNAELNGVVFIDGMDGTSKVADYASQGPNNELYLAKGQSITFQVQVTGISDISKLSLDLGAKLAKGDSAALLLNGAEYVNLATATDMYYDLGSRLTWKEENGVYTANVILSNETEGSIISLTNLKVAGGAAFAEEATAAALSLEEAPIVRMMVSRSIANHALAMLNASNVPEDTEPTEPEVPDETEPPVEVFTPENVEATWNACSAGGYATLTVNTSMDVDKLEVDGMVFTNVVTVPTVEIVDSQPIMHYHKMWTIHIQMMTSGEQVCEITAYNAEGISSEAIETSVTIY